MVNRSGFSGGFDGPPDALNKPIGGFGGSGQVKPNRYRRFCPPNGPLLLAVLRHSSEPPGKHPPKRLPLTAGGPRFPDTVDGSAFLDRKC